MPSAPPKGSKAYVREFAHKLSQTLIQGRRAEFAQGRMIDEVFNSGREKPGTEYWKRWPGGLNLQTFEDWCWAVLGCRTGKASYLRRNYLQLSAMDVADDTLIRALRLGWGKLALVLQAAKTEVDLLKWCDKVEEEAMTENDLRAAVKIALGRTGRKKRADGEGENQDPDETEEDPTIDPSEKTADGLDNGLPSFNPSAGADQPGGEEEREGGTPSTIPWSMKFDTEDSLRTFLKAIEVIKRRYGGATGGMGVGRAAALMATSYLASFPRDDQGGAVLEVEQLLRCIESAYGVKLEVVRTEPSTAAPAETKKAAKSARTAALDGMD